MKKLSAILLTSFIVFASSQATTVIPPTFDELVSEAELIFQGTVTDVKSQWIGEGAQRHIVSYVTFKVDDAVKGQPGASYTIRMLGGTVDDRTMEVTDAPKFAVGDRDIVFVENNGAQFIPLVGIMHGRFRVLKDETRKADVVVSSHGEAVRDLAMLGKEDPVAAHVHAGTGKSPGKQSQAAETAATLGAADFKAAIREKLAASR